MSANTYPEVVIVMELLKAARINRPLKPKDISRTFADLKRSEVLRKEDIRIRAALSRRSGGEFYSEDVGAFVGALYHAEYAYPGDAGCIVLRPNGFRLCLEIIRDAYVDSPATTVTLASAIAFCAEDVLFTLSRMPTGAAKRKSPRAATRT